MHQVTDGPHLCFLSCVMFRVVVRFEVSLAFNHLTL